LAAWWVGALSAQVLAQQLLSVPAPVPERRSEPVQVPIVEPLMERLAQSNYPKPMRWRASVLLVDRHCLMEVRTRRRHQH
jgi:hypothetical protein